MIHYTLGIYIFRFFIFVASFANPKAKKWILGRRNIFEKLSAAKISSQNHVVWIHCASLGEFEQARPVIEEIKKTYPKYKILLTFFSPSGYEIRKNYALADWVFYICLDTPTNAKKFIALTNPEIAVFIKYEFWYNHCKILNKNKIPIYSLSAIFRKNQYYFNWIRYLLPNPLRLFTNIFVQDIHSQILLKKIGINAIVVGDTRFDSVKTFLKNKKTLLEIERFKKNNFLLVVGSAWLEDIKIISEINFEKYSNLKIIIAPHLIDNETIKKISHCFKKPISCYSKGIIDDSKILIINNIGMLSSIYQYADIAYVGGAFGKGLHNILEPAVYGIPVLFGPRYYKFKEAIDLIQLKCSFSINSFASFENLLALFYYDNVEKNKTGAVCKNFVEKNTGATKLFLDTIKLKQ